MARTTAYLILLISMAFSASSFATPPLQESFKLEYGRYQELSKARKWSESLSHAENSLKIGLQIYGDSNKNVAALSYNYGLNLINVRRYTEAEKTLIRTLEYYKNLQGEESTEYSMVLLDLGKITNSPSSDDYFKNALAITEKIFGNPSKEFGKISTDIGVSLLNRNKKKSAKEYLYKGFSALEKSTGSTSPYTGYAAYHLGKWALSSRKSKEAILYLKKALLSFKDPNRPSSKIELSTHGLLVKAYEWTGKRDKATKHGLAIGRMSPRNDTQEYQPLVKVAPTYPKKELQKRKEGSVIVEFDIDKDGFVINPKAIEVNGSKAFIRPAIKAVSKFRYAPAFDNGVPVRASAVRNKITFALAK